MTPREITLDKIARIAVWHDVSVDDLLTRKGRECALVQARKDCAQYFMATGKSLAETARILRRDHTTIRYYIHGKKR